MMLMSRSSWYRSAVQVRTLSTSHVIPLQFRSRCCTIGRLLEGLLEVALSNNRLDGETTSPEIRQLKSAVPQPSAGFE